MGTTKVWAAFVGRHNKTFPTAVSTQSKQIVHYSAMAAHTGIFKVGVLGCPVSREDGTRASRFQCINYSLVVLPVGSGSQCRFAPRLPLSGWEVRFRYRAPPAQFRRHVVALCHGDSPLAVRKTKFIGKKV